MLRISSHKTRTLFLENFTKELILNSKPKETAEKVFIGEILKKPIRREITGIIRELPVVKRGGGTGKISRWGIEGAEEGVGGLGTGKIERGEGIGRTGESSELGAGGLGRGGIRTGEGKETSKLPEGQKIGIFGQMPKETSPEEIILKQKLTQGGPIRPYILPLSEESQKIQAKFTRQNIAPALQTAGGEINLSKLNFLSKDKAVTMIECPGPGKFITMKRAGQINLTKITLTQEEINEIIQNFSERARIPIVGGVFKVSVGNLTITAVVSDFVGSRFIIYKSSPYSLIS